MKLFGIESHRQVKINFKIWILYYSAKKKKKRKLTTNILKTIKNYDNVAPFLKRTNNSVFNCSLIDGLRDLIEKRF